MQSHKRTWVEENGTDCKAHAGSLNTDLVKRLYMNSGFFVKRMPFRVSEDDPASRYIFKIQRHTKLQLCAWNIIPLNMQPTMEDRLRSGQRGNVMTQGQRYFSDASICNIIGNSESSRITSESAQLLRELRDSVPLTLMSWDIEVSTRTGKFDDNGHDEENKIICICYTLGNPCSLGAPTRSVCIVTEDCAAQRLTGEQGECIEIVKAESELDMIFTLARHIHENDPTFITGFNDSSFDWPFLK